MKIGIAAAGLLTLCAVFVVMNRRGVKQGLEAPTHCSLFATGKQYTPTPPPGTYAWADAMCSVLNPTSPVVIRHYKRFGVVGNGLPADKLPKTSAWAGESIIDATGLDTVWYDPLKGAVGRTAQCVSRVECIDRENFKNIFVPYNSAYIFTQPVNAYSDYIGCSAVIMYDGKTLVYAHALSDEAPEACAEDRVTVSRLFGRLDKYLDWNQGHWRGWIVSGFERHQLILAKAMKERGIEIQHQESVGTAGNSVYWTQRTETVSIIPD